MLTQQTPNYHSVEAGDLIPHWRTDGMRPIVYTDDIQKYDNITYNNWLASMVRKLHVDYIICSAFHEEFVRATQGVDIPVIAYEADGEHSDIIRFAVQFLSAKPTTLYLFYHDPLDRNIQRLALYTEKHGIPVKWISW